MLKKSLLIFCVLSAAILIGCSTTETHNTNSTAANSNSSSGSTTASTPATTTSTTSAGDKIGVPECDDFIAKYEACVSGKVPEIARAQFQTMLKTWRTEWKKAADNPQTKAALAQGCKMSAEQANASMKAYGCSF
jgi:uncharacterized protein (DUF305 family)